jgi:hypothetical protein
MITAAGVLVRERLQRGWWWRAALVATVPLNRIRTR